MIDVPVQVKDALREGNLHKNYRFNVLNDDGTIDFTIDNNNLVSESVKIDERMASGDELKFGLCEGSSLEFQYFDWPNITGRRIQSFIDVEYKKDDLELTDTDSTFTVTDAGDYELFVSAGSPSFDIEIYKGGEPAPTIEVPSMNMDQTVELNNMRSGDYLAIVTTGSLAVILRRSDGAPFFQWYKIPMGFFDVKKCSRQASTGIIKVTAYNKLQSEYLDANIEGKEIPSDYTDGHIAVYGLRRSLLSDYSIITYEKSRTKMIIGSESSYGGSSDFYDISFKLTGDSKTWHPSLSSKGHTWAKSNNLNDVYLEIGDLTQYARVLESMTGYIYLYLTTSGQVVNPQTLWESLKGRIYQCACVWVRYRTAPLNMYYTTDELYEYAIEAGATDVRRLSDISNLYEAFWIHFRTPSEFGGLTSNSGGTGEYQVLCEPYMPPGMPDITAILEDKVYQIAYADMEPEDLVRVPTVNTEETTLRDIISASYELNCKFGQMDRETDLFYAAELNHSRLYPADTLYPADDLYPGGAAESAFRSQYSKLWADEGNIRKWRYLIITYKGLDEEQNEKDYTLQRTVNTDGTDDYNMSDNWLFRTQIWTAAQVEEYADIMVSKMQDVTWFPFEMWAAGLPYLETGDEIEIPLGDQTYTSYILQRQLNGIQNLQDTYINGTLDIF